MSPIKRTHVAALFVALFVSVCLWGCTSREHRVAVTLEGGTGRASITSPAKLTQTENGDIATIEWSSPHYDYMIVEGVRYLPVNEDGNSTFEIPVVVYDKPFVVIADTTAMSTPHEIEYQLTFDSSSIQ